MHVQVDYPDTSVERGILRLAGEQAAQVSDAQFEPSASFTHAQVFDAQRQVLAQHMAPQLEEYLVQLLLATRKLGAGRPPRLAFSWSWHGLSGVAWSTGRTPGRGLGEQAA